MKQFQSNYRDQKKYPTFFLLIRLKLNTSLKEKLALLYYNCDFVKLVWNYIMINFFVIYKWFPVLLIYLDFQVFCFGLFVRGDTKGNIEGNEGYGGFRRIEHLSRQKPLAGIWNSIWRSWKASEILNRTEINWKLRKI